MEGRSGLEGATREVRKNVGLPGDEDSRSAARAACSLGSPRDSRNPWELGAGRVSPGGESMVEEESGCREAGAGGQDEENVRVPPLWLRLRARVVRLSLGDRWYKF